MTFKKYTMVSRIIPIALLLFLSIWGNAQTPQNIQIQATAGHSTTATPEMACSDQFAGTISFTNFSGQSNDIDLDTIYFCFGDQIDIVGNGDADLTGDPNPLTTPGVTYGFYDCPPTISGPDLTQILMDNCIINDPPPLNGIYITQGGAPNGDITFSNNGTIQNTFNNNGNPALVWFAPITIDDFGQKEFESDGMGGPAGPCVNVNLDQAFAVVYLNEIIASNMTTTVSSGGCVGSFTVEGGLPEFDGSEYDIIVQLVTNPAITGTVMAPGGVNHGDNVNFSVPEPGIYSVSILDEKGCPETFLMDMTSCQVLEMSISSETVSAGDDICVDVVVQSGFNNIIGAGWSFNFDETVLMFTGAQMFNPNLDGLSSATINQPANSPGAIIFAWNSFMGEDLPNSSLLYQLCFTAIGNPGNCSAITFSNDPFEIEVGVDDTPSPTEIGFSGTDGTICIDGSTIVLDFMQTPVSCPGESDGDFTVDIIGGTAPYQLSWQAVGGGPVQGPVTIIDNNFVTPMNQAAGCYSVTVTDAGSAVVDTVCVESGPILALIFDENPPFCNDGIGNISVILILDSMVVNNTAGYEFIWSAPSNSTTANTGPITSGFYTVTVTAPNGCTATNTTFLAQPEDFNVSVNITPATCSGIDDGAIDVMVSGATPDANNDYTIQWPTIGAGLTFMNNVSNVNGLQPGCYPLIITDDNGCVYTDEICVTAEKTISVNAVVEDPTCMGTNTGRIIAVGVTMGAPADLPYTFQWFGMPPPPAPTNTPTSTEINGLGVGANGTGTYTLVMTDAAGCEIDTTFTITDPELLDAVLLSSTPETCLVGNDGTATIGVTGGTLPYSYDWGPGIANDSMVGGLSAGIYTVTVSDFNLCTDTVQVTISQPLPPVITAFDNDTLSCPENMDGTLTVTVANPADIVSYEWTPGNVGPGETIDNLAEGMYIVTVTANDGCTTVDTAFVLTPAPLVLDSVATLSPICPGQGNGQITLFVTGGTSPYFFDWPTPLDIFDGAGNATAAGTTVVAGTYEVTVTDANLCTPIVVEVTLQDPPSIVVDFSAIDSVSCFDSGNFCDGGATATAMYSDGSTGLFNFIWSSGEVDNSVMTSTATQLCKGNQTVIVADASCSLTATVNIPSPDSLRVGSIVASNVSCNGDTDGSILIQAAGGTAPYSYTWSTNEVGPMISNLAPGVYFVVIEDANGCSFTLSSEIDEPDPFVLFQADIMDVSCAGFGDGAFTVASDGGTLFSGNMPTYTWSGNIAASNSSIAENLGAGTYSVTGTDDKGCQDEITFTITEPTPITFEIGEIEPINCFNESTFITVESASAGPNSFFTFEVDNFGQSPLGVLYPVFAGEHTVIVYDISVGDGCFVDTLITITEPAPISVNLPTEVEIELGDTLYQLNPIISATTQIDSFIWSPPTGLLCSNQPPGIVNCPNPFVNITESMSYTLTIIDENGCVASDDIFLDVDANRNVFIPNIFTPNDDGRNDVFRIYTGLGVQSINYFRVFNRWGSLVFDIADIAPSADGTVGWDGRFRGERVNPDVYVYLIEVTFLDGRTLLYRGDVTVLR